LILGFGDETCVRYLKKLARQKLIGKLKIVWVASVSYLSMIHQQHLPMRVIVAVPQYVIEKNEKARAFDENFQRHTIIPQT